ncbi:MAG: hypothetical protein EPN26_03440 [Rhodospirillales bacterium]|nr:MAG: hypothetical protein EPN26_03440 [Rhodospirillales bacterium]
MALGLSKTPFARKPENQDQTENNAGLDSQTTSDDRIDADRHEKETGETSKEETAGGQTVEAGAARSLSPKGSAVKHKRRKNPANSKLTGSQIDQRLAKAQTDLDAAMAEMKGLGSKLGKSGHEEVRAFAKAAETGASAFRKYVETLGVKKLRTGKTALGALIDGLDEAMIEFVASLQTQGKTPSEIVLALAEKLKAQDSR